MLGPRGGYFIERRSPVPPVLELASIFTLRSNPALVMRPALLPRNIEVIDDDLAEVLRQKSPAERIEMISAANRTARLLAAGGVRFQHPDWNDAQVHDEVLRRVCGGTVRPT